MSLTLAATLLGCTNGKDSSQAPVESTPPQEFSGKYPIRAVVTVGMVADLVREIGGEHIAVQQLMNSGVDPHRHLATRDDSAAILNADIVFYNGLMLEGKMSEILKRAATSRRTFAAAETLPEDLLSMDPELADASQQGHPDPHVWMNVDMWSQVAQHIGDELARFDPNNADRYRANTEQLRSQLANLHSYGQHVMQGIPKDQRVLVTSHDAFRYFGSTYGVDVEAVQGISTESEAGLRRINELTDLLVDRRVQAVFIESSVPKESIESLLEGAASRGHTVRIGGILFSDAMGNSGTYSGTYVGMMDHNLSTIAAALGSTAVPDEGFQGWQAERTVATGSGDE